MRGSTSLVFIVLGSLFNLIPLILFAVFLFFLKTKRVIILLIVDVLLAVLYGIFLTRIGIGGSTNLTYLILGGVVLFSLLWATTSGIRRSFNKESLPQRVFVHSILTLLFSSLLLYIYPSIAISLLYSSNCEKNILMLGSREKQWHIELCTQIKAKETLNPALCDKLLIPNKIIPCKFWTNVKIVESGDLSACPLIQQSGGNYPTPETHDKCLRNN